MSRGQRGQRGECFAACWRRPARREFRALRSATNATRRWIRAAFEKAGETFTNLGELKSVGRRDVSFGRLSAGGAASRDGSAPPCFASGALSRKVSSPAVAVGATIGRPPTSVLTFIGKERKSFAHRVMVQRQNAALLPP